MNVTLPRQFKKLTLRAQTLLVVGAAITILASILFFLSRAIVLRGFAELEVAEVMENVERVRRALGEDLAYMKSIVGDYAPWDDTYEFMDDQNDQFVIANFTEGTLANIRIDLMILLDNAQSQVFGRAVDTETEVEGPVADDIFQALTAYSRLFKHDENHSTTTGLAHVLDGIMLVASHPIVKSDWSGPIRGTLVIGRYLSPSEVAKLSERTRLVIDTHGFDSDGASSEVLAAKTQLEEGVSTFVQPLDEHLVAGYALLEDLDGVPIQVLRVTMPRTIYQQALTSSQYAMLSIVGSAVVLLVVVLVLLERIVLARLAQLSMGVAEIRAQGDLSRRIAVTGTDELSSLSEDINHMLEAVEDSIAEHKRVVEEKRRMEGQLHIARRLAAIGELSAGVAHQLNNPLAAIQGYAELLDEREDLDEEARSDVEIIHKEAQRATTITGNLLAFARGHDQKGTLISINQVIEKSLDLYEYRLRSGSIKIVKDLADDPLTARASFHQLQEVFLNIITNAEQAMNEANGKGTLEVRSQRLNGVIRVSFYDDGPGISSDNLRTIFDPFFTTKDVGKGTGLGLSICHAIIDGLGGRIYALSEPGTGATLVVELKVADQTTVNEDSVGSIQRGRLRG